MTDTNVPDLPADEVELRRAIDDLRLHLASLSPQEQPFDCVIVHANLATHLLSLGEATGDPDVLREAITRYRSVLDVLPSSNSDGVRLPTK
jgi:hypothetical protein